FRRSFPAHSGDYVRETIAGRCRWRAAAVGDHWSPRLLILPHPVANFRHVLPADDDVIGVLGELVAHELAQMGGSVSEFRYSIDDVNDQVEPIQVVADDHVEGSGRCALLLEATDVEVVVVVAAVCEAVNEPWI